MQLLISSISDAEDLPMFRQYFYPESELGDFFGWPIAGDENTLFIGSSFDSNANGLNAGSVGVMKKTEDGWEFGEQILAASGERRDQFGTVAYDSGILAVGAPNASNPEGVRTGSVSLFKQQDGRWVQYAQLFPETAIEKIRFGYSVAVDDPYLVVGAFPESPKQPGFVSIYKRESEEWTHQKTFTPPYPGRYAEHVVIRGTRIAVGAPFSEVSGQETGLVYLYEESGNEWTERGLLLPSGKWPESFGESLTMDATTLAVGSPDYERHLNYACPGTGTVFLYEYQQNRWAEKARVEPWVGFMYRFGASVALHGDVLLVGAPNSRDSNAFMDRSNWPARVFEYQRSGSTWRSVRSMDSGTWDMKGFSEALFLQGQTAWIGAPLARDDRGMATGGVYAFDVETESPTAVPTPAPETPFIGPVSLEQVFPRMGPALALEGKTMVVADWSFPGALKVFQKRENEWIPVQTIGSDEEQPWISQIVLDGDQMMSGPFGWMYRRVNGQWSLEQKIEYPNPDYTYAFRTFGLSGDMLAVGYPEYQSRQANSDGAVFLYKRIDGEWTHTDTIYPEVSVEMGQFGRILDLDGSSMLIGSVRFDMTDPWGLGYLFERNGQRWMRTASFAKDKFNESTALSYALDGDSAVVAAYGHPRENLEVYFFRQEDGVWRFVQRITIQKTSDEYSASLSLEGSRLVIGVPQSRTILLYNRIGGVWRQSQQIKLEQLTMLSTQYDTFGETVGLSGNTVAVTARLHDPSVNLPTTFLFKIAP